MPAATIPDPESFALLPERQARRWSRFGSWDEVFFPSLVGVQVEDIREDYCRLRLPYRRELDQPEGVVHGGAIATLIDTAAVPAVGATYEQVPRMATLSMTVDYLGAVHQEDAVAHGWVVKRGRSIVFCEVAVQTASGSLAATASLVYSVRPAS
jgi:uncharacterized protein (TIGR00369 family)